MEADLLYGSVSTPLYSIDTLHYLQKICPSIQGVILPCFRPIYFPPALGPTRLTLGNFTLPPRALAETTLLAPRTNSKQMVILMICIGHGFLILFRVLKSCNTPGKVDFCVEKNRLEPPPLFHAQPFNPKIHNVRADRAFISCPAVSTDMYLFIYSSDLHVTLYWPISVTAKFYCVMHHAISF